MRIRPVGGLDLATGALISGGACLVAAAFIAAAVMLSPSTVVQPALSSAQPSPERPAAALSSDQVATVLTVDLGAGAGAAARAGDHVDVLGYFPRHVTAADAVTRVLLRDVQVLATQRSANSASLTLAVPQPSALLLQEAQALGARPFVILRGVDEFAEPSPSFSDADLIGRLIGMR